MTFFFGAALIIGSTLCFPDLWQASSHIGDDKLARLSGWSGEASRTLLLALGAWGGLIGLILAGQRLQDQRTQTKISQDQVDALRAQVELGESNLFNDRLGRAEEGLGDEKSLTMRNAGVRLLESLAKGYPSNSSEHELCIRILHGFIRERAIMPSKDSSGNLPPAQAGDKRDDISIALEV